jgi:hypothetical protein
VLPTFFSAVQTVLVAVEVQRSAARLGCGFKHRPGASWKSGTEDRQRDARRTRRRGRLRYRRAAFMPLPRSSRGNETQTSTFRNEFRASSRRLLQRSAARPGCGFKHRPGASWKCGTEDRQRDARRTRRRGRLRYRRAAFMPLQLPNQVTPCPLLRSFSTPHLS